MSKNDVPDWKLERYLLGELPPDELGAIAALEQSDGEFRGRVAALRASDDAMLAKHPPERMARKAMLAVTGGASGAGAPVSTIHTRQRGAGIPKWAVPAFACAALIAAVPVYYSLLTGANSDIAAADVYEDRVKGTVGGAVSEPALEVWRKAGDDAEMLAPETAVRTGDVVQLRYIVPKPCYGTLISVDGRGVLTVHLSGDNGKAAQLTPGKPVALKSAYKLDDAPKYEAFYLITAAKIFDLESVKATLLGTDHPPGSGQGLSLPQKSVTAFTLKKFEEKGIN
ncbi:MAG: hypothetical protein FWB85_10565 [Chitinispirillia bacterium]|nr:hypothetical protein [Chitinispirillia bacterium]MCL2242625.1 hypothetical protein [Chitinispirillia bacterium]